MSAVCDLICYNVCFIFLTLLCKFKCSSAICSGLELSYENTQTKGNNCFIKGVVAKGTVNTSAGKVLSALSYIWHHYMLATKKLGVPFES